MSRIDEALRRAAGETGFDETPDVPRPNMASTQDVAVLEREPFPDEAGNRAAVRQVSLMDGTPAPRHASADATRAVQEGPRTGAAEPASDASRTGRSKADSIFERIDARLAEKVVADANMSALSREQYRRIAAVLHDAQATTGLRVIMISSAVPGEGKTLTATNLSLTLSESYQRRVLLIDADLRKPTLHQIFKIDTTSGLTSGLNPDSAAKLTVHQVSPRLTVLPAGRPTSDPMAGLTSERMRRLLEEAKETFDWVIVDTPPLMLLPDAHLLASMVDGALLVIRAESTPYDLSRRAAEAIGAKRIIGVVLNQAAESAVGSGDYYYYGYYLKDTKGQPRP